MWIALANGSAADGGGRSEIAVAAAVFVGIVAHGVIDELAGVGVTTFVALTA